jgi:hypothetical protein
MNQTINYMDFYFLLIWNKHYSFNNHKHKISGIYKLNETHLQFIKLKMI